MSDSIIFRGAHIRYADLRHDEAGTLSRVHLTLKQHELQLDIKSVDDFKLVAITKDEVTRRELRGEALRQSGCS